jgi:hypothetical protein
MPLRRLATAIAGLALVAGSIACTRELSVPQAVAPVLTLRTLGPNPARAGDVLVAEYDVSAEPLECQAILGPLFSTCEIVPPRSCRCTALVPDDIPESVYAANLAATSSGGETRIFEPIGIDQKPPKIVSSKISVTQQANGYTVSALPAAVVDSISGTAVIRLFASATDPTPLATVALAVDGSIPLQSFTGVPPAELWVEAEDRVGHLARARAGNVAVTAGLAGRTRFRPTPVHLAPYFFDADGAPTALWPGTGAVAVGEALAAIAAGAAQVDDGVQAVTTAVFEPTNVVSLIVTPKPVTSTPVAEAWGATFQPVYDPARRRTVLFGGMKPPPPCFFSTGCPLDELYPPETWEFDGDAWTSVLVPGGPSPRSAPALAYDSGRGRAVLFGGAQSSSSSTSVQLADTWEWDGQSWTSVATPHHPTPRGGAHLVYDPARGRTILHGGSDGTSNCDGGFQSSCTGTWEYDGHDWTLLTNVAPSPTRAGSAAAWNAADGDVLLFGGDSYVTGMTFVYYGDFWRFDAAWSMYPLVLTVQSPPYGGCYDVARRVFQAIVDVPSHSLVEFPPSAFVSAPASALFYDAARRVTYSMGDATQMYVLDQRTPHARYAVQTFALDVASGATLGSLAIQYVGFGSGASGKGLALHAWNWATRSWDLVGANAAAAGDPTAAKTISASPPGPLDQYLDPGATRIWFMASAPASSATTESRVTTDYIGVQASYTLP